MLRVLEGICICMYGYTCPCLHTSNEGPAPATLLFHSPSLSVYLSSIYLLTYQDKASHFSYSGWPVSLGDLPAFVPFPSRTTALGLQNLQPHHLDFYRGVRGFELRSSGLHNTLLTEPIPQSHMQHFTCSQ